MFWRLVTACRQNDLDGVKFLLSKYKNIIHTKEQNQDHEIIIPLHICLHEGFIEIAKLLVSKGVNVNERDSGGITAMHIIASTSGIKKIDFLLSNNASINIRDNGGVTPIIDAFTVNNQGILYQLGKEYQRILIHNCEVFKYLGKDNIYFIMRKIIEPEIKDSSIIRMVYG